MTTTTTTTSDMFQLGGIEDYNNETHFLESCYLCGKSLAYDSDIFMYRGNTPFCSQDCRQDQIEFDEAKEKSWKMSSRSRKSESNKDSPPGKTSSLSGTVAVA